MKDTRCCVTASDESEKAREDARNLMLLEWAKELLLDEAAQ